MTNTNTNSDISYSDNSHLFGIPLQIKEIAEGFMDIPIIDTEGHRSSEGLGEWGKKVEFLDRAGIDMHLHYVRE